jgi:quinol monooxygenase YgiN
MPKLTIVAHVTAKVDQQDLVHSELKKLIAPTREEDGCVQYDLHRDNSDPAHFMFYETWDSRELWQQHMGSQHLKDFLTATDGAVEELNVFEMTMVK